MSWVIDKSNEAYRVYVQGAQDNSVITDLVYKALTEEFSGFKGKFKERYASLMEIFYKTCFKKWQFNDKATFCQDIVAKAMGGSYKTTGISHYTTVDSGVYGNFRCLMYVEAGVNNETLLYASLIKPLLSAMATFKDDDKIDYSTTTEVTRGTTTTTTTSNGYSYAGELSYNVGRDKDNIASIKSGLLARLKNIPSAPTNVVKTAVVKKTESFMPLYNASYRSINIPINGDYSITLMDRFANVIKEISFSNPQKMNLPINTLGSFYLLRSSSEKEKCIKFFVYDGIGELAFSDAIIYLDFSLLNRFVYKFNNAKEGYYIEKQFILDLMDFLEKKDRFFNTETQKAISIYLYLYELAKNKGESYIICNEIKAITKALS